MAEEKDPIGFNPVFDGLAIRTDLTSTEKIIIAHILRWGKRGCFESKNTFAKFLGINERTLDRAVNKLYAEEWITIDYNTSPPTYWITTEKLRDIPVFDKLKGCGKPVSLAVKSLRMQRNWGGRFVGMGGRFVYTWGAFCRLFNRNKKDLSYRDYREKKIKDKISKLILEKREGKKSKQEAEQFEASRRKLHEQIENLK